MCTNTVLDHLLRRLSPVGPEFEQSAGRQLAQFNIAIDENNALGRQCELEICISRRPWIGRGTSRDADGKHDSQDRNAKLLHCPTPSTLQFDRVQPYVELVKL